MRGAIVNPYMPVETEADLPKFCGVCGLATVPDLRNGWFDRMTGQGNLVPAVRCPKGRCDDGHEAFVVSPAPKSSIGSQSGRR